MGNMRLLSGVETGTPLPAMSWSKQCALSRGSLAEHQLQRASDIQQSDGVHSFDQSLAVGTEPSNAARPACSVIRTTIGTFLPFRQSCRANAAKNANESLSTQT